jgi:hypothetical protein
MFWRVKSWMRRMVWKAACALARTQGVNLNRAIYVGPGSAVLTWHGDMLGHRINGAAIGLKIYEGVIQTLFDAEGMTTTNISLSLGRYEADAIGGMNQKDDQ